MFALALIGQILNIGMFTIAIFKLGIRKREKQDAETEKWRIEQERLNEQRHKDNRDAIHSLSNSVHAMLITVTSFDAWKIGHENLCSIRWGEVKEALKEIREHLNGNSH